MSYAAPVLTWTGDLAVGASAVITYTMTVNTPDTGDKVVINTATSAAAGSTCPLGATAAPCRVTVAVLTPGLTIAQSAGAGTTTPGSVVTYTVTVTNSGQIPYTGAAFTDPLSGVLDDAAYNNDAAATSGSVSFASPNLSWTGNLAPGASATITFSVTVNSPDVGNHILASTITSVTTGNNCPAGTTDPRCATTVTVSELTIDTTADVATATPGSLVNITTTMTNTGQTPYFGISVTFDAPGLGTEATSGGPQTASSGTLSVGTDGAVWTGDIPVGGTVTITGSVIVDDPYTGNPVLSITDVTTAPGSNCPAGSTDPRCVMAVDVLIPALTIVKTASTTFTAPGTTVGYTITVTDTGQTSYTGAVVTDDLTGVLDDAAYNGDAAATAGSVSYTAPHLTWTGNLAPGAAVTITYSVTVNNPDTGDKTLIGAVTSSEVGSTCPPGSVNASCSATVAVLTPALTITKTASTATAVPGQVITYTITVTNTGQLPYTGTTVADDLTGVLDDAAYNAGAAATTGSVSYAAPVLTWTGNLNPGATATITYSVTVSNPDTGNHILSNTVTSAAAGSNCASGSTDPRCTTTVNVVDAATLTIAMTSDVTSATAGSTVHYTVTVANSGESAYAGASFTDPLAGVLDDAAYNGDAAATSGTVTYTSPDLTWTGTVPAAGTVTVTYSVTVNSPDAGNWHPGLHAHLAVAGERLRLGEHRPAVHRHGDGVGADDRYDG